MLKGIQFLLIFTTLIGTAYAKKSDDAIAKSAISACRAIKSADYDVRRKPLKVDPKNKNNFLDCYRVKCSVSSTGAGDVSAAQVKASFPNDVSETGGTISGWTGEKCDSIARKSDEEIIGELDIDADVDTDVDADVRGGVKFDYYYDGDLVSYSYWKKKCNVKSNKRTRKKCKKKRKNSYDDDYYSDDDYNRRRRSSDGKYVIVRNSDGSEHKCYYTSSYDHCTNGDSSVIISVHGDMGDDCEDCRRNRTSRGSSSTLSGIAEIAGAILPPLAYLGSSWLQADAYLGANQAWAGAATAGFEQCQLMQTNHTNSMYGNGTTEMQGFFSNNELPYENVQAPGCNGYQLGGFAGGMGYQSNGYGGFGNSMMSAGYSPGFMGGMSGPYGMYNPYGSVNGMGMGGSGMGINIGIGGGMGNGMGGGMYPGMGGGIGIGIGGGMGGMNGGMYPGMGGQASCTFGACNNNGGMYPGMGGMYPGMGGMSGGIGMNGGMGGMYPGMGGTIGMNGGYNGGMPGGGMYGNPWNGGGSMGMGTVPYGNTGGYWNGSGGYNNGNGNYGNIQQSYQMNQQALGMDSYYQQAALQNSYGQAAQNMSYGQGYSQYNQGYGQGSYGYSPYSPSNMGLGMSMGFGFGF
jgi:hypothetical protein